MIHAHQLMNWTPQNKPKHPLMFPANFPQEKGSYFSNMIQSRKRIPPLLQSISSVPPFLQAQWLFSVTASLFLAHYWKFLWSNTWSYFWTTLQFTPLLYRLNFQTCQAISWFLPHTFMRTKLIEASKSFELTLQKLSSFIQLLNYWTLNWNLQNLSKSFCQSKTRYFETCLAPLTFSHFRIWNPVFSASTSRHQFLFCCF